MSAIFDTLKSIGSAISSIFDFVIGFFEDIAYVIKITGKFVAKIPSYFDWLPAEVLAIIVSAFAVVVIYKILGREG